MTRAEKVKQILLLEAFANHAKQVAALHRDDLATEARAELAKDGTAPTWRLPLVAQVVLPISKEKIEVSNADHLLEWVEYRYPAEVETISSTRVRPSFVTALTGTMLRADGDVVLDPETGEIVPGVSVRKGGEPGALSIKPDAGVKAAIAALAAGMMDTAQFTIAASGPVTDSTLEVPRAFDPIGDPFTLFPPNSAQQASAGGGN